MAPLLTPPPLFQTAEEVPSLHVMTRSFLPITGVTNVFLTLCKCGIIRSQIGFTYSSWLTNDTFKRIKYAAFYFSEQPRRIGEDDVCERQ